MTIKECLAQLSAEDLAYVKEYCESIQGIAIEGSATPPGILLTLIVCSLTVMCIPPFNKMYVGLSNRLNVLRTVLLVNSCPPYTHRIFSTELRIL